MRRIYRIRFREIPREQAEREIAAYIKEHLGKNALDVALALRIEPRLSFDICDKLVEARIIGPMLEKKL